MTSGSITLFDCGKYFLNFGKYFLKCEVTIFDIRKANNPKKSNWFHTEALDGDSVILGHSTIRLFSPKIYDNCQAVAESTQKPASKLPFQ